MTTTVPANAWNDGPSHWMELCDELVPLYRWAVQHGQLDLPKAAADLGLDLDEVDGRADALVQLHLLRLVPGPDGDLLVPVDPESAAASLIAPAEIQLRHRLAEAELFRSRLISLVPVYAGERPPRESSQLTVEPSLDAVMALIEDWSARCTTELITCQPGGDRPQELVDKALPRDRAILARGVRQRTLYQHTARAGAATQSYVRSVTALGGEVRTLPELFGKMVAFDRQIAFIPCRDDQTGAVIVREPSTVAFLCRAFDLAWSVAEPYTPVRRGAGMSEDIKQAIVRLLAEGLKDEVIARRLGMSIRTCRKHIAEIMDQLGATSRFQLGYLVRDRDRGPA
ncbi:LuxR C-terminal-related transcriptional regulator [Kitasatospora sp. McL0602]|uniref:helix-turn-helix transcriptional regulator n=1 Tax=Kitasatospora sp. McL0602 TaxID=3439530 RepID=UPI003F8C5608